MEDNGFKYTYSSAQNQEVKNIRDKYINSEKSKIEQLKELDAQAPKKAFMIAMAIVIVGAAGLVAGIVLSFVLKNFYVTFVICFVSGLFIVISYPAYYFFYGKEKKKNAEKIIELANEILDEKELNTK